MRPRPRAITALIWAFAVLVAGAGTLALMASLDGGGGGAGGGYLASFNRKTDLADYLNGLREASGTYGSPLLLAPRSPAADLSEGGAGAYYSTTNVQVQGVDEEDIVKTDGEFLYLASYVNVTIVRAYPPDLLSIVSRIEASDILGSDLENKSLSITGLFLASGKLVVVANVYTYYPCLSCLELTLRPAVEIVPDLPHTLVAVFDVSAPEAPMLLGSVGISGYSLTSRMIGSTVYLVTQHYIWFYDQEYLLPRMWEGAESVEVDVQSIYYDPSAMDAGSYVNLLAVDLATLDSTWVSIIASYASTIYVSPQHLYLTFQKWVGQIVPVDDGLSPEVVDTALTSIYKIRLDGLEMVTVAQGDVPGWLLNQFSMDEQAPYLRVATTTDWSTPENAVYVLDEDLDLVGKLEGLAPTERIYSARFVGDTLYLVTFRQVDPLFVIDVSNPFSPQVVGELELPGFSSYLHPIDATHVLGIGREGSNVKLSLFDVSDPFHPVEMSKYIVEGQYSYSTAEYDHKAVLIDAAKELLVLPMTISSYVDSWSGFYIFDLSGQTGITLRGTVEHPDYPLRSLYIGDFLYTISGSTVKVTSLVDLSPIGSIIYQTPYWWGAEPRL